MSGAFGRNADDGRFRGEKREEALGEVEQGADVQGEGPIEVPQGELFEGAMDAGRSAVNQGGEGGEAGAHFLHHAGDALLPGEIATEGVELESGRLSFLAQVIGRWRVADVTGEYPGPGLGETEGDGATDAAGAAGHQDVLADESEGIAHGGVDRVGPGSERGVG